MTRFRAAVRADVAAVVELLRDDGMGASRETGDPDAYLAAFDAMEAAPDNHLIVGEDQGRIVATYQITFITGLSLAATRRAQIEGVRVASARRGHGLGHALMLDAETRARAAGCSLMQLTSNAQRTKALAFYEALGFTASHTGFKRKL